MNRFVILLAALIASLMGDNPIVQNLPEIVITIPNTPNTPTAASDPFTLPEPVDETRSEPSDIVLIEDVVPQGVTTPEPAPTPQIVYVPEIVYVEATPTPEPPPIAKIPITATVTGTGGCRVRDQPSVDGAYQGTLLEGERVEIIESVTINGELWLRITFREKPNMWIRDGWYLTINYR